MSSLGLDNFEFISGICQFGGVDGEGLGCVWEVGSLTSQLIQHKECQYKSPRQINLRASWYNPSIISICFSNFPFLCFVKGFSAIVNKSVQFQLSVKQAW